MTAVPTVSTAGIATLPDAAAIEAAASSFDGIGAALSSAMDTLDSTWDRLQAPGVYETPESMHVHDAMHGPRQATEVIAQDAASARSALQTYAQTLATLATRRASLVQDIGTANDAASTAAADPDADLSGNSRTATGLLDRISGFNADVVAADGDCAAALRSLARYTQHELGDAAAALNKTWGPGGVLGVAGGLMSNYDDLKDALIGELQMRGIATAGGTHIAASAAANAQGGVGRGQRLPGSVPDEPTPARHVAGASDLEGVSKAMRYGGKALGVVGTVATIGGAYAESYNESATRHPEWTEGHRNAKAAEHAVVTGGVSAAGGIAGGIAGAEMGAAIGTMLFPGAGTVVGGLVGGLAGGLIGSNIGEKMGQGAEHFLDKVFHW